MCARQKKSEKVCALCVRTCACVSAHDSVRAWVPYLTAQAFQQRKWCEVKDRLSQCGYSWIWPPWAGPGSSVHRQSLSSRTQTHSHTQKGEQQKERNAGGGGGGGAGGKVTRGEKMEKGVRGGNGRRSVWLLPFHKECRCDGLTCKTGPTQTCSALIPELKFGL